MSALLRYLMSLMECCPMSVCVRIKMLIFKPTAASVADAAAPVASAATVAAA